MVNNATRGRSQQSAPELRPHSPIRASSQAGIPVGAFKGHGGGGHEGGRGDDEEARNRGANAVVAMRFDTSEMGDTWTEICAYGTAVVAVPVTDAARETATRLGYSQGGMPQQGQAAQPSLSADAYGGGQQQ